MKCKMFSGLGESCGSLTTIVLSFQLNKLNVSNFILVLFSILAGKYAEALELAKLALKWEEKELGKRPERMVELYGLLTDIYDEVCNG